MRPKKQHIYTTAAQLFRERGYKAASMRELAQRVQLQVSSLYSHIGSKEEILRHICFENAAIFGQEMAKIETQPSSAVQKIKALIRLHIQVATENTTSITIFNDEWRHLSEPHLSIFLKLRKDYENRFLAIIQAGIESGELKQIEPTIALYTLLNSVQWLHDWWRPERTIDLETIEANLSLILLDGIQK